MCIRDRNLPYYYDDIVELAIKMGSINPNPSDNLRNKVEQNYWDFMANIILDIEKDSQTKLNKAR